MSGRIFKLNQGSALAKRHAEDMKRAELDFVSRNERKARIATKRLIGATPTTQANRAAHAQILRANRTNQKNSEAI